MWCFTQTNPYITPQPQLIKHECREKPNNKRITDKSCQRTYFIQNHMKQCKRKNNIIKLQRIRQSESNIIQKTAMKEMQLIARNKKKIPVDITCNKSPKPQTTYHNEPTTRLNSKPNININTNKCLSVTIMDFDWQIMTTNAIHNKHNENNNRHQQLTQEQTPTRGKNHGCTLFHSNYIN